MDFIMNNDYLKTISERLKAERLRLNLKQTDILKHVDVAISTFSSYENGKRSPDIGFLLNLGELGYDVGYVVLGERELSDLSTDELAWLDVFRGLKSDDRERLMKMAKSLL